LTTSSHSDREEVKRVGWMRREVNEREQQKVRQPGGHNHSSDSDFLQSDFDNARDGGEGSDSNHGTAL
jgi:hypothetical protein